MLVDAVPRGHRHHQLVRAVECLEPARGSLLDIGAGSGWLSAAWPGSPTALDVFASGDPGVPWVVGSTGALPFRSGSFDQLALLASLGAFQTDAELCRALGEVSRVLRPGGRVTALASTRNRLIDAVAPHRIRTRWRWRSFEPEALVESFAVAGLTTIDTRRYGGIRSLAVDWAATVLAPLLRRIGRDAMLTRIGEWDAPEFRAPRDRGRYIYLVAERAS